MSDFDFLDDDYLEEEFELFEDEEDYMRIRDDFDDEEEPDLEEDNYSYGWNTPNMFEFDLEENEDEFSY